MTTTNVHAAGGDLLLVMPVPSGWGLRWYIAENDVPSDYDASTRNGDLDAILGCLMGPAFDDEEYAVDGEDEDEDDDDRTPEQKATDTRELAILRRICCDATVQQDEDGDPIYYYWTSRQAAEEAAEAIMAEVRHDRAAPWADAAIAAGWTPPPQWKSAYRG